MFSACLYCISLNTLCDLYMADQLQLEAGSLWENPLEKMQHLPHCWGRHTQMEI